MEAIEKIDWKIFEHPVDDEKRKLVDQPVSDELIQKNKYANNAAYTPDSVYRRILNKVTNYKWSFVPYQIEVRNDSNGKPMFVEYTGLLIVPGFGIHTGVGTQSLNKKDNQNAMAVAKTYAFKNACKEMGLAPNIGDETWDAPVFEDDEVEIEDEPPKAKAKKVKPAAAKKTAVKKTTKKSKKYEGVGIEEIDDQIEEIRDAYEIADDDELVAFLQIWNEEILDPDEMTAKDWKKFFKYIEGNKSEFEDF